MVLHPITGREEDIMTITAAEYETIKYLALDVLEDNDIGNPPVVASDLARRYGFKVICANIQPDCVAGFIDVESGEIVVNREDTPDRQNFTIAHELGHFLLKHHKREGYKENYSVLLRNTCVDEETPMEQEASLFAESLLVPVDFLWERIEKYPLVTDLQLARMFGVPISLIRDKAARIRRRVAMRQSKVTKISNRRSCAR
jgi:Zn-dependent peptidase ImmA (M78 family)